MYSNIESRFLEIGWSSCDALFQRLVTTGGRVIQCL